MLNLAPETETILEREAAREGVSIDTLIRRVFMPRPPQADQKALNLIAAIRQWQAEDATDDPEELDRRRQETTEHHANLDHPRQQSGMRLLFPDEAQP